MKTSKIIRYLKAALNQNGEKKKAALKDVISKMKKKEHKLRKKLSEAKTKQERDAIKEKIAVNRAHRKKGIAAMRELQGKD